MLLNLHSMSYCTCMHADVMVCICQTLIKKLLTYLPYLLGAVSIMTSNEACHKMFRWFVNGYDERKSVANI